VLRTIVASKIRANYANAVIVPSEYECAGCVGCGDAFADDGAAANGCLFLVFAESDGVQAAQVDEDAALVKTEGVCPSRSTALGDER
jgi:hypothetical protein